MIRQDRAVEVDGREYRASPRYGDDTPYYYPGGIVRGRGVRGGSCSEPVWKAAVVAGGAAIGGMLVFDALFSPGYGFGGMGGFGGGYESGFDAGYDQAMDEHDSDGDGDFDGGGGDFDGGGDFRGGGGFGWELRGASEPAPNWAPGSAGHHDRPPPRRGLGPPPLAGSG